MPPNPALNWTGARGSGCQSRGRAPMLLEGWRGRSVPVRRPPVKTKPLGIIPPTRFEVNGLSHDDRDRVRSAIIRSCSARVPSDHQLAGPGSHRCPNGPAAGVGTVADGSCQADCRLPRGGRSDRPRPRQRSGGAGPPCEDRCHGPASRGFGSVLGRLTGVVVAGFRSRPALRSRADA